MKACTCKTIVRNQEHETACPQWLPLWRRKAREELDKRGFVAVVDKTSR